jgi:hypothetical protein
MNAEYMISDLLDRFTISDFRFQISDFFQTSTAFQPTTPFFSGESATPMAVIGKFRCLKLAFVIQ